MHSIRGEHPKGRSETGDWRRAKRTTGVVEEDGRAVERGELVTDEGVACTAQHRTRTVPAEGPRRGQGEG